MSFQDLDDSLLPLTYFPTAKLADRPQADHSPLASALRRFGMSRALARDGPVGPMARGDDARVSPTAGPKSRHPSHRSSGEDSRVFKTLRDLKAFLVSINMV